MGKNTLYEPAWKMYESPNAGEPVAEDGYVPRNRNARPGLLGIMPDITDRNYTILNDPVLIKQKQALKAALKEEYLKQAYNPYRHAAGAGGMPVITNLLHNFFSLKVHFVVVRYGSKFSDKVLFIIYDIECKSSFSCY